MSTVQFSLIMTNSLNSLGKVVQDKGDLQKLMIEIYKNTKPQGELDFRDYPIGIELLKKATQVNSNISFQLFYSPSERSNLIENVKQTIADLENKNTELRIRIELAQKNMEAADELEKVKRKIVRNIISSNQE